MSDLRREKDELRKRRTEIDGQILALLGKRAKLSRDWAMAHPGETATLPSTERETLDALATGPIGDVPPEAVRSLFREIHAVCRTLETPVRVAYAGAAGGRAYAAARKQFGPVATLSSELDAVSALALVESKRADFAVLPYETTAEGPDHATLLALKASDVKIVAVHEIDVALCLVARGGTTSDVSKVYATADGRAKAKDALSALVPRAVIIDVKTPLEACQAAASEQGTAALAIASVASTFDLEVLAPAAAQGQRERYCVAASRPASRTSRDATAVLFTANDEPGALFEVLKHFAERGVNLRKIHSRPSENDGWDYLFFLEVTGHITDRGVTTALEGVKKQTKMLKVIGSYPV